MPAHARIGDFCTGHGCALSALGCGTPVIHGMVATVRIKVSLDTLPSITLSNEGTWHVRTYDEIGYSINDDENTHGSKQSSDSQQSTVNIPRTLV